MEWINISMLPNENAREILKRKRKCNNISLSVWVYFLNKKKTFHQRGNDLIIYLHKTR